jgi:phage/plasmid-like protein (TIGR03299 family)
MPALVESMFSVRQVPWHELGIIVQDAPTSEDAIRLAGLNWRVEEKKVFTQDGILIPNATANVRSSDGKPLGIVGDRYTIVQNEDAFKFTDELLGEGVKYETAGSLRDGKTIWLLAKMPETVTILGDEVTPYIVFTNTHDGSGSVKVAMTPVRVVCNNTLNLALNTAKRTWTARHTGSINNRLQDATETLQLANKYMTAMKNQFDNLYEIKLTSNEVTDIIEKIVPIDDAWKDTQKNNMQGIRDDITYRFYNAPDLRDLQMTGARIVQAVADTASHIEPIRITKYAGENRMKKAIEGDSLLDRTLDLLVA